MAVIMNKIERAQHVEGQAEHAGAPELPKPPGQLSELTAREAVFCQWYVDTRNVMQAYRQAYEVPPHYSASKVYSEACAIYKRPHVLKHVRALADAANAQTIVKAVEMLQDLYDIATADPNELSKGERFNCRNCNGTNFGEQWRDAAELARAMDRYLTQPEKPTKGKMRVAMPDASGGFGFNPRGEPNPVCPHCNGDGWFRAVPPDTTKLTPKARKLYAGLEFHADGTLKKVLMHDQMQARDMIIKMLGAYKSDGKGIQGSGDAAAPIPANATAMEAQQAYLKLVQG